MSKRTVGIIDYGAGNHASVRHCLHQLDLRCRVSDEAAVLKSCDVLVLPGVGAFRPAMKALSARKLDRFIVDRAGSGLPILGICLGMQMLTDSSMEDGYGEGLRLIPGRIVPIAAPRWHIGWNTVELIREDAIFQSANGQSFYFNHSYVFEGPAEFQICRTRTAGSEFASVIRRRNVIGVQFHPEKSQDAGRSLLMALVSSLCHA